MREAHGDHRSGVWGTSEQRQRGRQRQRGVIVFSALFHSDENVQPIGSMKLQGLQSATVSAALEFDDQAHSKTRDR